MALLHQATIQPTKLELLAAWLPGRAGDGPVHHAPLTYRDAPLAGADAWLVGTCEHSVLGRRWVYDACGDPVYAAALAAGDRRTGRGRRGPDARGDRLGTPGRGAGTRRDRR